MNSIISTTSSDVLMKSFIPMYLMFWIFLRRGSVTLTDFFHVFLQTSTNGFVSVLVFAGVELILFTVNGCGAVTL